MLITVEQYILHAATNMYKNKKKTVIHWKNVKEHFI